MTLEGSRKFLAMWLGILATWVLAKYGPEWGGVFNSAQVILLPLLASGLYMLINYAQKSTADTFVPDNWLAGKRTIIGLVMALVAPMVAGATLEFKDALSQTVTLIAEVGAPVLYMIFQAASDKKLAAPSTKPVASTVPVFTPAPEVITIPTAPPNEMPVLSVKERIKIARQTYGTWEGAKALLLGSFKARFEAALRRLLMLNPSLKTIDAARLAVFEVVGVNLDDKACEAIGQVPGMLGAVGASADIKIISDLLAAIDKMPELAYMKTAFTKIAVRYGVKAILDEVTLRVQAGAGDESSKKALEEFGLTRWQIDKTVWEGSNPQIWYSTTNQKDSYSYRQFDPFMLAGVDAVSLEDV